MARGGAEHIRHASHIPLSRSLLLSLSLSRSLWLASFVYGRGG
jgi:hypothetical protein